MWGQTSSGQGKARGSENLTETPDISAAPGETLSQNQPSSDVTVGTTSNSTHGMTMRRRNPKITIPPEVPQSAQTASSNSNRGGKSGRRLGKTNIPQPQVLPNNPSASAPVKAKKPPKTKKAITKYSMPIISSTVKLRLGAAPAAFGDVEDIFNDKVINDEGGGTIRYNVDVRRKFIPGNYILHIIKIPKTSEHGSQYGVILCREDVDPVKIYDLMKESSYMVWDFRLSNGISRYDWKHFRNWGSFEHEQRKMEKQMKRMEKRRAELSEFGEPRSYRNYQEAWEGLAEFMAMARNDYYSQRRSGWSPPSSPEKEPEPEKPKKTPEEIAHDAILSKFKTILLDYFKNKDKIVKQCTLFVDSGKIQEIGEGKFTMTQDNDWVYIIRSSDSNIVAEIDEAKGVVVQDDQGITEDLSNGDILGFLIKESPRSKAKTLIAGDWHHGCVLQDTGSQEYFGFVFGDCFESEEVVKNLKTDIAARNYIWDINQLLLS